MLPTSKCALLTSLRTNCSFRELFVKSARRLPPHKLTKKTCGSALCFPGPGARSWAVTFQVSFFTQVETKLTVFSR